jgi:hypothetical protein
MSINGFIIQAPGFLNIYSIGVFYKIVSQGEFTRVPENDRWSIFDKVLKYSK